MKVYPQMVSSLGGEGGDRVIVTDYDKEKGDGKTKVISPILISIARHMTFD